MAEKFDNSMVGKLVTPGERLQAWGTVAGVATAAGLLVYSAKKLHDHYDEEDEMQFPETLAVITINEGVVPRPVHLLAVGFCAVSSVIKRPLSQRFLWGFGRHFVHNATSAEKLEALELVTQPERPVLVALPSPESYKLKPSHALLWAMHRKKDYPELAAASRKVARMPIVSGSLQSSRGSQSPERAGAE